MAVAFDAFSSVAAGTGNLSWTHTPVGTPKGVRVDIVENGGTNGVSGVTYGGVAMELVSANSKSSGEAGTVVTYFLGKSIPTGAQTVSVTVADAVSKRAGAITLTAASDTCWISTDVSIGSDSLANPTSTLNLRGKTCFVSLAGHSGQNAATGTTQSTGWTNRLEHAFGSQTAVWYTYDTIASSNVACGWTQTADDAVMVALAITEAPLATDSQSVGLTESASKTVVFDSRTLPILLVESARLSVVLSVSDTCAVSASQEALSSLKTVPVAESLAVQGSEAASVSFTSTLALSVTESLGVVAGTESASISSSLLSASDVISVQLSEAKEVINTQTGAVVVALIEALGVTTTDVIASLFVFSSGSTQNFTVSDSFRVALNGSGVPPTSITATESLAIRVYEPLDRRSGFGLSDSLTVRATESSTVNTGSLVAIFSVSDSLAVRATDVSAFTSSTIVGVTDSCQVNAPEDLPTVATAVAANESLRVSLVEQSALLSCVAVLDTLRVGFSEGTAVVGGLLTFFTTDSLAVQASELTSFGQTAVKTVESLAVQCGDALTNSSTVSAVESVRVQAAESLAIFKDALIADSLVVRLSESAFPVFDDFVDFTTTDTCAVQVTESISDLVSFLIQLTASDSLTVQAADVAMDQSVVLSALDTSIVQVDAVPGIFIAPSVADSLAVQFTEAGMAIPIVTVNVSTFADDTISGFDDAASIVIDYEAIARTVSDTLAVQESEDSSPQPGYYADDDCLVGVGESAQDQRVANNSRETWNGNTMVEHNRERAHPGKYRLSGKHNW